MKPVFAVTTRRWRGCRKPSIRHEFREVTADHRPAEPGCLGDVRSAQLWSLREEGQNLGGAPRRHGASRGPSGTRRLAWGGPDDPGDQHPVTQTSRDGHAETWYAADATLGWWGPDGARRLVVATADPATLPGRATWYLVTSMPRPGGPREAASPHPAASLAETVRIYGLRNWVEQSYRQVKDQLGWADFQVRSMPRSAATRRW